MLSVPGNDAAARGSKPGDRTIVSTTIGIIGFAAVWTLALIKDDGHVGSFWSPPGLLAVIVAPVAAMLAVVGWTGIVDAAAWIVRKPSPDSGADEAVSFFQLAAAFAMASGFLATLIGLVAMLMHVASPSQIGPGVAQVLLSQLYGVFAAVICIAIAAYISRRHNGVMRGEFARRAAGVAGITTIAGTLTTLIVFAILMLSLAPGL